MNYATGHAINLEELFTTFNNKRLKVTSKQCDNMVGSRFKSNLVYAVFRDCVELVLNDIIDNNATFELPTRARKSKIKMKRIDGDDFIVCRQRGKFSDIDYLKSNFTGYKMIFDYQNGGIFREKDIHLDPTHRDKITKYTNEGKSYY